MAEPTRILFVCLGNIVRSPLAEHMFRRLAADAGLGDKYEIDSAGTSAYHVGESPDSRMRRVAAENGLVYNGRARQFTQADMDKFDLILAMDTSNLSNVLEMTSSPDEEKKVILMREFDPQASPGAAVPDPYYGGVDGFYNVYKIIERTCQNLLAQLEAGEIEL